MNRVSVVMSCYNSEQFVSLAIKSILDQSYSDFEFIIWNDGSTDRTEEIIKSFKDDRIRYFYHENTGLGKALRLACEQAQGEYIARMDADDISKPDRFEKEVNFLDSHKNVVLVSSAVEYIDDCDRILGISFPFTNYAVIKKRMLSGVSVVVHPSSMFRREVYEKAGGYIALKKAQDGLLFPRMMQYGSIANLKEVLLSYRVSDTSISSQTDGNNYTPVLSALRKKMIKDNCVSEADVFIYNELVGLAKKSNLGNLQVTIERRKKPKYEYVYDITSIFIGSRLSRSLIIQVKNLVALFVR